MIRTCVLYILSLAAMLFLCSCVKHKQIEHYRPDPALENAQLGLKYLQQGYTDLAQEKLQLALLHGGHRPLVLQSVGYYYEKTGEVRKANHYYLTATQIAPNSGTILNNYGAFLCRNGYYKRSLDYFRKAASSYHKADPVEVAANVRFCRAKMHRALGTKST